MRPCLAPLASASLAFVVALLASPPSADACTGSCPVKRFAPANADGAVPASVVAFPVENMAADDLVLSDASGAHVDGKLVIVDGFTAFRPTSPLSPGRFTATWTNDNCGTAKTPVTFTVTEALPLPSKAGELEVASANRTEYTLPSAGGLANDCTHTLDVAKVDLSITPDPALVPFRDATVWQWRIDGGAWISSMPWAYGATSTTLIAVCDARGYAGSARFLALGTHDIESRAVVGDHVTEPSKLRVRVSCGPNSGELAPSVGPLETEEPPPPASAGGSSGSGAEDGCAVRRGRATGSTGLLVVAVALAAKLRRRARST